MKIRRKKNGRKKASRTIKVSELDITYTSKHNANKGSSTEKSVMSQT